MASGRLPVRTVVLTAAVLGLMALPVSGDDLRALVAGPGAPDGSSAAAETTSGLAPTPVHVPDRAPSPEATAPLTGVELDGERAARLDGRAAAIVKIPNNERAHPHTGLEQADVVYEQEIEGGTTRFAAVFHSRHPELVGNVRSARPVDIPLVAPYRGVFLYAGARREVLDLIAAADLVTVGAGGPGYVLDPSRRPPHHLYSRLREAVAAREAPAPPAKPWRFATDRPRDGWGLDGPVRVLMSPVAATTWAYDPEAGVFRRRQNGRPHEVTGPGRIGAANVVLLDVPVHGRDSAGAPAYELSGAGDALLLRDGRAHRIGWSKVREDAHLRLEDREHRAVLRPGPTWILLTHDGVVADLAAQLAPPAATDRRAR